MKEFRAFNFSIELNRDDVAMLRERLNIDSAWGDEIVVAEAISARMASYFAEENYYIAAIVKLPAKPSGSEQIRFIDFLFVTFFLINGVRIFADEPTKSIFALIGILVGMIWLLFFAAGVLQKWRSRKQSKGVIEGQS
jgi:hypothetical protein